MENTRARTRHFFSGLSIYRDMYPMTAVNETPVREGKRHGTYSANAVNGMSRSTARVALVEGCQ